MKGYLQDLHRIEGSGINGLNNKYMGEKKVKRRI